MSSCNNEIPLKWYEWNDKDDERENALFNMLGYIFWGILFGEVLKSIGMM